MSLSASSTSPARTFNWADDDEDDDFNLDTWKATADISAPSASSLGPLNIEESSSSSSSQTPKPEFHYTTLSSFPPNEDAPWKVDEKDTSPPQSDVRESEPESEPEPKPARRIINEIFENMDHFNGNMTTAHRALRYKNAPPAYPELNAWDRELKAWKREREGYAQEWKAMKVRSGWGGKCGTVMYRFSRLWEEGWEFEGYEPEKMMDLDDCGGKELWMATRVELGHDEELEPVQDAEVGDVEAPLIISSTENTEVSTEDSILAPSVESTVSGCEAEDLASPFIVSSLNTVAAIEGPAKEVELAAPIVPSTLSTDFEEIPLGPPVIVSSTTTTEDNEFPTQGSDLAPSFEPTNISGPSFEDMASPLIVSSPAFSTKAQEISQDDTSAPHEVPLPLTTTATTVIEDDARDASPSDLSDAFLSDSSSDADSSSSSVSSVSLPLPTFTVTLPISSSKKLACSSTASASSPPTFTATIPIRSAKKLASNPPSSSSSPQSLVYDATHIGISHAAHFIKKRHPHSRRDFQEVLQHGEEDVGDLEELDDRPDAMDDCALSHHVAGEIELDEQEQDLTTYVCNKATQGWGYISHMSWTTAATIFGVGVVLGGCFRAARR